MTLGLVEKIVQWEGSKHFMQKPIIPHFPAAVEPGEQDPIHKEPSPQKFHKLRASGIRYSLQIATASFVLPDLDATDRTSPKIQAPRRFIGCLKEQPLE